MKRYAIIDTEGANTGFLSPIALEVSIMVMDEDLKPIFRRGYFIQESIRFLTSNATAFHGITKHEVTCSHKTVSYTDVMQELSALHSKIDVLVCANVGYDISALENAGVYVPPIPTLDLCADSRILEKFSTYNEKRRGYDYLSVNNLYKSLFGRVPSESHRASADVETEYEILVELINRKVL